MIDLQTLKDRINIIDVAEELGLDPKRSGSSHFARCPSHDDQGRPNMAIDQKKGAICFRCGYKADVIRLVADVRYHGDQGEAIRYLANKAGMTDSKPSSRRKEPLPKGASLPKVLPAGLSKPAESSWNSLTVTFPAGAKMVAVTNGERKWVRLDDGRVEVTYTPDELVFALAYSEYNLSLEEFAALSVDEVAWILSGVFDCELTPADINTALTARPSLCVSIIEALLSYGQSDGNSPGHIWLRDKKGISQATQTEFGLTWLDWERASAGMIQTFGVDSLHALGLMTRDKKTGKPVELRFKKHRLLFPFWITAGGKRYPIYLQGRDINAGKDFRFDNMSGSVPCPYNFDAVLEARHEGKPVFICEGATDTLTLAQAGFKAVGIIGTQGFKPEWVKHFDGLNVYIATDPDEPGQEAAKKIARIFDNQGRYAPKVIPLPEGQDINDYFTGKKSKNPVNG